MSWYDGTVGTGGPRREVDAAWLTALRAELPGAVELRHELHARPELSGAEGWTADRVAAAVTEGATMPIRSEPTAGTGRLLRIGPADGPAIAVRAELDALPVRERTGAPWASTSDAMHACGHDVHLAGSAALARAAARANTLPAALLLVLQPREETQPSGARDVVTSGALGEHDVRATVGVHLQPQLPVGSAAADPGVVNAAVDEFEIQVVGTGGHSAYPHLTRDPVPVLCRCVLALQEALRSAVDPMFPAVLSVTMLEAGRAPNVIPGTASARGTLRTFRTEDRDRLDVELQRAVSGIASAGGCTGTARIIHGEPALRNDPALAMAAAPWLAGAGFATSASFRSCGSDDFAHYGSAGPSLMIFLGAGTGPGSPMLHDPMFLPSDELVGGVARAALAGYLAAAERYVSTEGQPRSIYSDAGSPR